MDSVADLLLPISSCDWSVSRSILARMRNLIETLALSHNQDMTPSDENFL